MKNETKKIAPVATATKTATPPAPPRAPTQDAAPKKERVALVPRTMAYLARVEKRVDQLANSIAKWGNEDASEAAIALGHARTSIQRSREALAELPSDFVRKGAAKASSAIVVGAVVAIRDNRAARYAGAIEASDMARMTVVKIANAGKLAVCTQADGARNMIPTAHLRVVSESA